MIVIAGAGAEDACTPFWAHCVSSLSKLGYDIFQFDPIDASRSARRGTPQHQWEWVLDEFKPDLVLAMDPPAWVSESITARDIEMKLIDDRLGINVDLLVPVQRDEEVDVVFYGDASLDVVRDMCGLVSEGLSVRAIGSGWNAFAQADPFAHGEVPYPALAEELSKGRVVLVDSPLAAQEAAACARVAVERFPDGSHFDEIQKLLSNPAERQQLGNLARDEVVHEHNVKDYFVRLLPVPSLRVVRDGPRVTVVTGMYNIAEFIGTAIESVLDQTMGDFELLIVDDASPDESRRVVEKYLGDTRIKLLEHHDNIGQTGRFDLIWRSLARNARGEFWAGLGGDDRLMPDRLELQLQTFVDSPAVDIVHGACWWINESGERAGPQGMPFSYDSSNLLRRLLLENIILMPTAIMRRGLDREVGEWAFGFACDYHYWTKSASKHRYQYLPVAFTEYRRHEKSASTGTEGLVESFDEAGRVRRLCHERNTLLDCFPALEWATSVERPDWAAAYVDLANAAVMRASTADFALSHYQNAVSLMPELATPLQEGITRARGLLDGTIADVQHSIGAWHRGDHGLLLGPQISALPFTIPPEHADDVFWWDATPISLRRVLLVVDWNEPRHAFDAVGVYLNAFAGISNVDLAFITLGVPECAALEVISQLIPHGIDLDFAPPLTLERCDSIEMLPLDRYAHIVDCTPQAAVAGVTAQSVALLPELAHHFRNMRY